MTKKENGPLNSQYEEKTCKVEVNVLQQVVEVLSDINSTFVQNRAWLSVRVSVDSTELLLCWDYEGEPGAEELQRSMGYRTAIRIYADGQMKVMFGMHTLNSSHLEKRTTFNEKYDRVITLSENYKNESYLKEKILEAYKGPLSSNNMSDFFFFE